MLEIVDSLSLSFAVISAKKGRLPDGTFPAARNVIFGTAFAITSELFLTAGHVANRTRQTRAMLRLILAG